MEVLQNSLKETDLGAFTTFQLKVWNILNSHLKNLIFDKLSEDSLIEMGGIGVDVFLRLKTSYFILYMSIQKDSLVINSEHFDIYVYPETRFDLVNLLVGEILLGNYEIILSYGVSDKLVRKEVVFDNHELNEFNQKQKIGLFGKKVKRDEKKHGVQLIDSIA